MALGIEQIFVNNINIYSPFHTQQDHHHKTTTNRKSVKNWYIDFIGGIPAQLF